MNTTRPGIEILLNQRRELIAGKRVALLTNQSGVLRDLTSSARVLAEVAELGSIFTPEHGLWGAAVEGEAVGDDTLGGVPIHSLYGTHDTPTPEQLRPGGRALDAVVCDLQDVGCRFYTYAWTVTKLLRAAAEAGVPVIVCDRPNPIGDAVEGPGIEPAYRSLVGLYDVPIRHGLTLGELARLVNHEADLGCTLTVVPCAGWTRSTLWSATGLPWVPPSPGIPTAETTLVYPGTCLLEGVNVSVGRGSARPFEWLGAPWIDGQALADMLNDATMPGLRWRALRFRPLAEPYRGVLCGGVQPHVVDAGTVRPVAAGVALLLAIRSLHPAELRWNETHFDRLAGCGRLRESIAARAPLDEITGSWDEQTLSFRARAATSLIEDYA